MSTGESSSARYRRLARESLEVAHSFPRGDQRDALLQMAQVWQRLAEREAAEAANGRACRLARAISRMSATYQQGLLTLQRKRTGGNQHVTVKHIHQQVTVTEGGQAVVAGDKVMSRTRGRRRSDGGGMVKNER